MFFAYFVKSIIMYKQILFVAILFISNWTYAQNSPIDFETNGNGADWTWTTFENDDNPALEIIDNPDKTGDNTSDKVAKFTARPKGQPWAGCESKHGADIGTFTLNANTSQISIMVWKPVISDVGIKLVDKSNGSLGEIKIANTKTNTWEKITFDFKSREGIEYDQIVIFMDFASRNSDNVCYFDNVQFGSKTALPGPQTPAIAPTHDESKVISMYCGVYTDVDVNSWRTSWSSALHQNVAVMGDSILKYSSLDFVGIETVGSNSLDVSEMDHFNLDIWTPNSTLFKVKLVDFGEDNAFGGGDDTEHELEFNNLKQKEWNKLQIPLTDFKNLTSKKHISQIIFASVPSGSSVVYIDNLFFSKGTTSNINSSVLEDQISMYPNPAHDVVYVETSNIPLQSTYAIINTNGVVVRRGSIEHGNAVQEIILNQLETGCYLLSIQTEKGKLNQRLIIH